MAQESYKVSLPVFEGPMDLLLSLIEKHKLDIYDIPIAIVTKEYLDYLAKMTELDLEPASDFLVMAATLLLIKSRMMLPRKQTLEDEFDDAPPEIDDDPRQELVARLLEYRRYKELAQKFAALAEEASHYVGRAPQELPLRRLAPMNLSAEAMAIAFRQVMLAKEEADREAAVVRREKYTVEDRMGYILARLTALETQGRKENLDSLSAVNGLPFTQLFMPLDYDACLTTFLALLELVKLQEVYARQEAAFGEIIIARRQAKEENL